MNVISFADFQKVDVRVGTIVEVNDFPEAHKPAYRLLIDLGEELGLKKSSAQITVVYGKEELIGRQVVCVCNFPKKQIGPFQSEVLVTGFENAEGNVVLAIPERKVANGQRLH